MDGPTLIDLSVVIPVFHDVENLEFLLPSLRSTLDALGVQHEIIVVDYKPGPLLFELCQQHDIRLLEQPEAGYGVSLVTGYTAARGEYILTMDADFSHPLVFIDTLWENRLQGDLVVASRYVTGGAAHVPLARYMLSRVLNLFFSRGLSLKVRDMSSGFRLYRAHVLRSLMLEANDFSIVQEVLVKAYCEGWTVVEIPFFYNPSKVSGSWTRVFAFGRAYLRTFVALYKLRNSILSADYDDRAYDSVVWPQRYWQRQRFRHITELLSSQGPVLDVGCGSSRIISALPDTSVALDILFRKLRYSRRFGKTLVNASGFYLPFRSASFSCVICSQVIEHVPKESPILDELCRVLMPGGLLILGTPDYGNWQWNVIEAIYQRVLPSAYADEHISHYTRPELIDLFKSRGFTLEKTGYILRGELILALRKGSGQTALSQ